MSRISVALLVGLLAGSAAQAVVVTVPTSAGVPAAGAAPAAPWFGYMNVSDLGGAFIFGSPWGVPDIRASFDDGVPNMTVTPNAIDDPNPFWYTPSGGPGAVGNKRMDALAYIQQDDVHNGTVLTFEGFVTSNTLLSTHTAQLFIRDFAPDYSSFNEVTAPATVGPFSLSLNCDPAPGRHVQYGINVIGPCVWITDIPAAGSVVISSVGGAPGCNSIDFNGDGLFPDDSDLVEFLTVLAGGDCTTNTCDGIDFNNDGLFPDDSDLIAFLRVLAGGSCTE